MEMREIEYWMYKDGQPPYIDTQFYLAEVGSKILFGNELYSVMEWRVGPSNYDDELMIMQCICDYIETVDMNSIMKSLIREQKINDLLNGKVD